MKLVPETQEEEDMLVEWKVLKAMKAEGIVDDPQDPERP